MAGNAHEIGILRARLAVAESGLADHAGHVRLLIGRVQALEALLRAALDSRPVEGRVSLRQRAEQFVEDAWPSPIANSDAIADFVDAQLARLTGTGGGPP